MKKLITLLLILVLGVNNSFGSNADSVLTDKGFIDLRVNQILSLIETNENVKDYSQRNYVLNNLDLSAFEIASKPGNPHYLGESPIVADPTLGPEIIQKSPEYHLDPDKLKQVHGNGIQAATINTELQGYNTALPTNVIMLGVFDHFVWRTHYQKELRFGTNYNDLNKDILKQEDHLKAYSNAYKLYEIIGNIVSNKTGLRIVIVNFAAYEAIINQADGSNNNTQKVINYYWHNYTDIKNGISNNETSEGKNLRDLVNNSAEKYNFDLNGIMSYNQRIFNGLMGNIELVNCSSFTTYNGSGATGTEIQKITDRTVLLKKLHEFNTVCFEQMSLADRIHCFTVIAADGSNLIGSDETTVVGLLTSTPETQQAGIITYFRTPNGAFGYYQGHLNNTGVGEEYSQFFSTLARFYCTHPDLAKLTSALTQNRKYIKNEKLSSKAFCNTPLPYATFTDFDFEFNINTQSGSIKETNNSLYYGPEILIPVGQSQPRSTGACPLETSVIGSSNNATLSDNWDIVLIIDPYEALGSGDATFGSLSSAQILEGFKVKIVPAFYLGLLESEQDRDLRWRVGYGVAGTIGAITGVGALAEATAGWSFVWAASNIILDVEQITTAIHPEFMADLTSASPALATAYQYFSIINGVRGLGLGAYKTVDNLSTALAKVDEMYNTLSVQSKLDLLHSNHPKATENLVRFVNKFKTAKIVLSPSTWKTTFINALKTNGSWSSAAHQSFIVQLNADLDMFSELNTFFKGLSDPDRLKFANLAKFAKNNCLNCSGSAVFSFRSKKTLQLLDKINSAATPSASYTDLMKWVSTLIDDASLDRELIVAIDNLNLTQYGSKLNNDLISSTWGNEIKMLFKENPSDLTDIWILLKDDPATAWQKFTDNIRWEKWSKSNFFKSVTAAGREFENTILGILRDPNRLGANKPFWDRLAQLVPDLSDRRILSQVQFCVPGFSPPCKNAGEYWIADLVFVKYTKNANGIETGVESIIIADSKLRLGTQLSTGQGLAFAPGVNSLSIKSFSSESDIFGQALPLKGSVNGFNASRTTPVGKTTSFKIYGGETGGVGNGVYSGMD